MDTKGWDIIFGCSISTANKHLENYMKEIEISFDFNNNHIHFSGIFAPWSIIQGGSGKLLHFKTPIKKGTLSRLGKNKEVLHSVDLEGVCPVMELQLKFIENTPNHFIKNLKFNLNSKGLHKGDSTDGAVTTINADVSGKLKNEDIEWELLNDHLPSIFIENQGKLAYIFSKLNTGNLGSMDWLVPKRFDYMYSSSANGKDEFITILGVVTDRDISSLPREIDGEIMDAKFDSFTVISEGLFLNHMLLPEMPKIYNTEIDHFEYISKTNSSGYIESKGEINAPSFDWSVDPVGIHVHLATYSPKIHSLHVSIENNQIVTSIKGNCDLHGIGNNTANFSMILRNEVKYNPQSKSITFLPDPKPEHTYSEDISNWQKIAGYWWGGPFLGYLIDVLTKWILESLTNSLVHSTESAINTNIARDAGIIVEWGGMKFAQLTECGLNQAFYIRENVPKRVIQN
ncbi:TULIP family P47-like protein [Bacillus sp. 2SH]|uniref:TULIP family P47-like protein n=1 Tax=Bacillus sp. 2SH TaxID=2502202 RepID=UPI0010F522B5|nr:TULIP family P47-like protein [Bacillus sp. 2SH]